MKKLKLNLQNIEGAEVLTRAQLKNLMGGSEGEGGGSGIECAANWQCPVGQNCTHGYCSDGATPDCPSGTTSMLCPDRDGFDNFVCIEYGGDCPEY